MKAGFSFPVPSIKNCSILDRGLSGRDASGLSDASCPFRQSD
jgi:hypothetical protein